MSKPVKPGGLPFEWMIALRYTRGGRRKGFISFISFVSVLGITLGVAVLILVLSVVNGFQKEVRDRMLSVLAHVELADLDGTLPWRQLDALAARQPGVTGTAPFVELEALAVRGETMRPVLVRGIDPVREARVSDLGRLMRSGAPADLRRGENGVLLGRELAAQLHAARGDRIALALPAAGAGVRTGAPRIVQLRVAGVFEAGHYEFDSMLAYVHIADAIERLGYAGPVGIRVRAADMGGAPRLAASLRAALPAGVLVTDWTQRNRTWFAAVQSQKTMLGIIITMIMAVATFNLVSTLILTVADKQGDIAILRTLGASPRSIMQVFVLHGLAVGALGTVAGVVLGVIAAVNIGAWVGWAETLLGRQLIPKDIYLVSTLPSEIRPHEVAFVAAVALALALVSTLYPSWRAARTSPARALRHE